MTDSGKKAGNAGTVFKIILALIVIAGAAYLLRRGLAPAAPAGAHEGHGGQAVAKKVIYTCSMHPQIRQDKPGRCPICGMELVPVETEDTSGGQAAPATAPADTHAGMAGMSMPMESTTSVVEPATQPADTHAGMAGMSMPMESTSSAVAPPAAAVGQSSRRISFSDEAAALMQVETAPVERKSLSLSVSMPGKIDYDETTLSTISAWIGGRVDKLYVNYTGASVRSGDPLAEVYSPDLYSSRQELLKAVATVGALSASTSAIVKEAAANTVSAAREKLKLLGMTDSQLAELEKTGVASDHVTIYANSTGTVVSKDVVEGQYIETGMKVYTLADLSAVWAELDAYESDLSWLSLGQEAAFEAVAYPGEKFTGKITFIDPTVDAMSRTARVRVEAPNPDGKLKPEMLVRAQVAVTLDATGKPADTQAAVVKYTCPMHPQVVSDKKGACPICGMALVPASAATQTAPPLVIPSTAPLLTGTRAVVYVSVPGQDRPTFEGRVIELGPRAGDYYIVLSGLNEGERVVTRGNFKIDASIQIQAKPSMMSPEGGAAPAAHQHGDTAGHSGN